MPGLSRLQSSKAEWINSGFLRALMACSTIYSAATLAQMAHQSEGPPTKKEETNKTESESSLGSAVRRADSCYSRSFVFFRSETAEDQEKKRGKNCPLVNDLTHFGYLRRSFSQIKKCMNRAARTHTKAKAARLRN